MRRSGDIIDGEGVVGVAGSVIFETVIEGAAFIRESDGMALEGGGIGAECF